MKNKLILDVQDVQQDRRLAEKTWLAKADVARFGATSHAPMPQAISRPTTNVELALWRWRTVVLLRVLMGCFCVGDAWLKWHANIENTYLLLLSHAASSQTPVISNWFAWWLHLAQINVHAFVVMMLLLEIGLGMALIFGAFTKLACTIGIALTLLGFMGAGLLDGFFGQGSFDVGVMIVFLLVFPGLLLSSAGQYLGLDRWLRPAGR
ncbi:hypothetical protein KDA_66350 [Dictyobacter alpinus]|uniref:TQO small subunit DoxD domain-containing protein n=1 Tax=Dictyobacter alpinus TaxID=2014873 RepID=A0A402BIA6_9CHLR|nr:hypothetical protein [Dictyobacter alpinus]GCE31151.1 hypothetical protein KDA_66350 [Dictyobacter alpinus]